MQAINSHNPSSVPCELNTFSVKLFENGEIEALT